MSFRVGSPPQKFVLIADTGSDLTWMHCNHKGENCPKDGLTPPNRMFQADASSTFKTIPCSSRTCKVDLQDTFSLSMCPTPVTPCAYDYRFVYKYASGIIFFNILCIKKMISSLYLL